MKLCFLLFAVLNYSFAFAAPGSDNCAALTGFHVTNVTPSSATLTWDDMSKAEGYIYLVSKSVVPPTGYGHFIKEARHVETGLGSAVTYYAHVRSKCSGAEISKWSTIQFSTPPPATTNIFYDKTFAVSVTPAKAERSVTIKVKGSIEGGASIWIEDATGRSIGEYTMIGESLYVEVASLEPGIYYVCYNDALGRIQWLRFTK